VNNLKFLVILQTSFKGDKKNTMKIIAYVNKQIIKIIELMKKL